MLADTIETNSLSGCQFITHASNCADILVPEDLNEEHMMIRDTVRQFIDHEFIAVADRLEAGELDLNVNLLRSLGDLGMLGTHMPEDYGGMALDEISTGVILEEIGRTGAFSTTYGAHTGIGMLPILYYGTRAQKSKYLPILISGEKVACYCLTEPGSGSDALAAKTTAILNEAGTHYVLNGQKMWISNAGFADIFIVFAKVDGVQFTGFIVEKGMEGLSLGEEEKKLGIKGSSTRQVFFEDLEVPLENVLGEIGKGHLIAFNVLNSGRYKIGPSALGGAKALCDVSIEYANERKQFGQAISSFGAIKSKIAEQAIQLLAVESACYRTTGIINNHVKTLEEEGKSFEDAKLIAAEEYALESSILKVAATDMVNYVADECVQIHGGMGYSEETKAARGYRDSRIAMIYEGTNEINRMLMLNLIFKRAMSGKLDIASPALKVQQELISGSEENGDNKDESARCIENFKKLAVMLLGSLGQLAMKGKINLKKEQELLISMANILIDLFLSESFYLRVEKENDQRLVNSDERMVHDSALQAFLFSANHRIRLNALEAVGSFVKMELQEGYIDAINSFCDYPLKNMKVLRRNVAEHFIAKNKFSN